MATETPPNVQVDELSIQELDQALNEVDPEFSKGLDGLRQVAAQTDIEIDTATTDDGFDTHDSPSDQTTLVKRILGKVRVHLTAQLRKLKNTFLDFISTKPKEFLLFSIITSKRLLEFLKAGRKSYAQVSRAQIFGALLMIVLFVTTVWIVSANLKGRWLPELYSSQLISFSPHADAAFEFDPFKDTISFFRAFPQDPEIFLFNKIKVNLRRASGHPNPMGAFEIYAQVDSHDTAIELQTRQVEMHDIIARVFEEQSYNDLVSELGKSRLKGIIKKEIDHALTQGWVNEVHFKNFILKP